MTAVPPMTAAMPPSAYPRGSRDRERSPLSAALSPTASGRGHFFGGPSGGGLQSPTGRRRFSLAWRDTFHVYSNVFCYYTPRYVAGFLTNFFALKLVPQQDRSDLVMMAFVRAIDGVLHHFVYHQYKLRRRINKGIRRHFDSIVFMASTQIICAGISISTRSFKKISD